MAWSEERKEKARATRRANREAKAQQLEDLRSQIADLESTCAQLEQMNEDLQKQLAANNGTRAAHIDPEHIADLCAERTLRLFAVRLRSAAVLHDVGPEPIKVRDHRIPDSDSTETAHSAVRELLESMTIQELNAKAIEMDLDPDYHRDRLINRIVEAQAK